MHLRPLVPHRWHNDPGKSHNYTRHRYVLTCKVWHKNRRSHIYHHLQREGCLIEIKKTFNKHFNCLKRYWSKMCHWFIFLVSMMIVYRNDLSMQIKIIIRIVTILMKLKGPLSLRILIEWNAFPIILLWPYFLTSKFSSRSLHILYPTIILWVKYKADRATGKANILWTRTLQRSATTLNLTLILN